MHRGLHGPGRPHASHAWWQSHSRRLARQLKRLANACQGLHASAAHAVSMQHGIGFSLLTRGMPSLGTAIARASKTGSSPQDGGHANGRRSRPGEFGDPARRATDVLLAVNCLMYALQWLSQDSLTYWGAKVNSLIAQGQVWRLFTSSFLHGSAFHLAVNGHALNTVGPQVEAVSGRARFVAVYLASSVIGAVASYYNTRAPSIGASGGICGLSAALAVFYWRHREVLQGSSHDMLKGLGLSLAINAAYSLVNHNMDNWGHLGGLLGGAATAWLLGPHLVRVADVGPYVDRPPLGWLAHKDGTRYGRRRSSSNGSSTGGSSGGSSGDGAGGKQRGGEGGSGSSEKSTGGGEKRKQ